jgi:hypothetical protein
VLNVPASFSALPQLPRSLRSQAPCINTPPKHGGLYAVRGFAYAPDCGLHRTFPRGMSTIPAVQVLAPALEAATPEQVIHRKEATNCVHAIGKANVL